MCGLAFCFGEKKVSDQEALQVSNLLRHRGPDCDKNIWNTLNGLNVFLHHSRLAIIDLDARSSQPFIKGDYTLILNGEIYNFLEIKMVLEKKGHTFKTTSDTEVVLESYKRWGTSSEKIFEGMWALILVDKKSGGVWVSRDRFGEKPLYFCKTKTSIIFASQIKALATLAGFSPEISENKALDFLIYGHRILNPNYETWFKKIRVFPPASSTFFKCPKSINIKKYWNLSYKPDREMEPKEAESEVSNALKRAVSLRINADRPLAFCLSGGIDSSLLVCIANKMFGKKINSFSIIDKDKRYNESENINKINAFVNGNNIKIHLNFDHFFERLKYLSKNRDGPVSTISSYINSFLCEEISKLGFKVALSGNGADELFTGYYNHFCFWINENKNDKNCDKYINKWNQRMGKNVENPFLKDPKKYFSSKNHHMYLSFDYSFFNSLLNKPRKIKFYENYYSSSPLRNRMLNELKNEIVPVILKEDDLNSMFWSIENRSPYLDKQLAELAFKIPNKLLIKDGYTKWFLRLAGKEIMPKSVRLCTEKKGFNASIKSLVNLNDKHTKDIILKDSIIFDLINKTKFKSFLNSDFSENSKSKFLFSFISLKTFLDKSPF